MNEVNIFKVRTTFSEAVFQQHFRHHKTIQNDMSCQYHNSRKNRCQDTLHYSICDYTEWMFNAFEFITWSFTHPIKVSWAVLFQAPSMKIQCYYNVCCALTNWEPIAGKIIYSLCKNTIMKIQSHSEISME
jgi:hypothetical protein